MISAEQWELFRPFREGIEAEYTRSVTNKPERLPAYEETIGVLKEAIERYGIDRDNPEEVYYTVAGLISSISFVSQYFSVVCNDQHMMGHLHEASVFLGYLARELLYVEGAPAL